MSLHQNNPAPSIQEALFGTLPDGRDVKSFLLTNGNGLTLRVLTYGGIITSLKVPDRNGRLEDIVLGYDHLEGYLDASPYFGAIIGRYGNRIAKGRFSIDGVEYHLAANNGPHHLHGGINGFDKVIWHAGEIIRNDGVGLKLSCTSPDMEEGYPGQLEVEVIYFLEQDNTLTIDYTARTTKKTIVNLTHHSYFNLTGMREDIRGHELQLNASAFIPVDDALIPTGEIRPVAGTSFDFMKTKKVGRDIDAPDEQLSRAGGYDHCWALEGAGGALNHAASLYEAKSGRLMEVYTTEPGIQFFSANFGDKTFAGKDNKVYGARSGLCLETQHFPDSPNRPAFPPVWLEPGEVYKTITKYVFLAK